MVIPADPASNHYLCYSPNQLMEAHLGREMVRLVLQQLNDPSGAANQVVFATELVLRGRRSTSK